MRPIAPAVLAALTLAGAAHAQDHRAAPQPAPQARSAEPAPPPQSAQPAPLSQEDAELVKELALLEQLELVRNLELFQPGPDAAPRGPQRQP